MNSRHWHFLTGLFLTLGLTNLWPVADIGLVLLLVRKEYRTLSIPSLFTRIPPLWFLACTCLSLPVLLGGSLDIAPFGTVGFLLRSSILILLLGYLSKYQSASKFEFWAGAFAVIVIQIVTVIFQRFLFAPIPHGIANSSSILGLGSAALIVSPVGPLALVPLSLSLSRTFVGVVLLSGVWFRSKPILLYGMIGLAMLLLVSPDRISFEGVTNSLDDRALLNSPPVEWVWYGIGLSNYNQTFDLQAPHNIWILSWWELGVFSIPFWLLLAGLLVRFRLWHFIPIVASGLFTPELFFNVEGTYALALWQVSWQSISTFRYRGPR